MIFARTAADRFFNDFGGFDAGLVGEMTQPGPAETGRAGLLLVVRRPWAGAIRRRGLLLVVSGPLSVGKTLR
jgi:hypothetical protein